MNTPKRQKRMDTDSEHGDQHSETGDSGSATGGELDESGEYEQDYDDDEFDPKNFIEEERSKLSALLEVLSDEELKRYEAARRCSLKLTDVEKTMGLVLGRNSKGSAAEIVSKLQKEIPSTFDEKTVVLITGLTKLYLAEILESARIIASEYGHDGRIQPRHLREAYRRMKHDGKLPGRSADGLA
jgi:transcription initiation factor TFIID subunit 11